MFETVVRELVNKFFGNYFENIDDSHLDISVWRGDVVLKNVDIRSTAMVNFYLPFQVIAGRVGTITLKVPWKSLYTEPVEATLKDTYLIISPSQTVPYNQDEEELHDYLAKMKTIEEIEETRQSAQNSQFSSDLEGIPTGCSYKERLLMHIIQNLQLRIDGLHIRYEDTISNPVCPFSFGIVMSSLHCRTTDASWNPLYLTETMKVNTVNKLLTFGGLGLYLNSDGDLIGSKFEVGPSGRDKAIQALRMLIPTDNGSLKYMIGPICTEIKVHITPNPETLNPPFSMSKVFMEIILEHLSLGVSNMQVQNLFRLIETIEFMARGRNYRKFRPSVSGYSGNYGYWWKFAYDCVVSDIRRQKQGWNYSSIKNHRYLCKTYSDYYYQKIVLNNTNPEIEARLAACEKVLDVFNLILLRAQVQLKKERLDRLESEKKKQYGWLSTLIGWNAADIAAEIGTTFEEAWTSEERDKLNKIIGYNECSRPIKYPSHYIAYSIIFSMKTLDMVITEYSSEKELNGHELVKLFVEKFETTFDLRPVKLGYKFKVKVKKLKADTIPTGSSHPSPIMKTPSLQPEENVLEFTLERRPLNSTVDKRIKFVGKAIEFIHHATTLNKLVRCFSIPAEIQLKALRSNAKARIKEWKENLSNQFRNWIQNDSEGEVIVDIDLDAPYILIPENGDIGEKSNVVIVDLGHLQIQSVTREVDPESLPLDSEYTTSSIRPTIVDSFIGELKNIQIVMAVPGLENGFLLPLWTSHMELNSSTSSKNLVTTSTIDTLIANIVSLDNGSENKSSPDESSEQTTTIIHIMNPVTVSTSVSKSDSENSIIQTKVTDISFRMSPITSELFNRISKSWDNLEDSINSLLNESKFESWFSNPVPNPHPRSHYIPNLVVHSYILQVAEGSNFLTLLQDSRKELRLDKYLAHVLIGLPPTHVVLVTTRRVFYLSLTHVYGITTIVWEHKFEDFAEPPSYKSDEPGITFFMKEPTPLSELDEELGMSMNEVILGYSSCSDKFNKIFVAIPDPEICLWILAKMTEVMTQQLLRRSDDGRSITYGT